MIGCIWRTVRLVAAWYYDVILQLPDSDDHEVQGCILTSGVDDFKKEDMSWICGSVKFSGGSICNSAACIWWSFQMLSAFSSIPLLVNLKLRIQTPGCSSLLYGILLYRTYASRILRFFLHLRKLGIFCKPRWNSLLLRMLLLFQS